MKVINNNFSNIHIAGYYDFRRLPMAGILNNIPTSTTLFPKPYYPFDNFNKSVKVFPALFTVFKDQELWENWNYNAIATAYNQDI